MYILLFWRCFMKKYDGVLKRVRFLEKKNGISYAKTDGKLYTTMKVLYSIAGVWTFFMNLFFILGFWLQYDGTDDMPQALNYIITASVCTVFMIAGYVLSCCKIHLAGGILSVIPEIFLIVFFGMILRDTLGFLGFKLSFYWRHFAPLVLMIIFITVMTVIAVREKVKTNRMYKKVSENLYNMYNISVANGEIITDEQWDEFLANYNPDDYKKQFKTAE